MSPPRVDSSQGCLFVLKGKCTPHPQKKKKKKKKRSIYRNFFCLCFTYKGEPNRLILPKKKGGGVSIVHSTDKSKERKKWNLQKCASTWKVWKSRGFFRRVESSKFFNSTIYFWVLTRKHFDFTDMILTFSLSLSLSLFCVPQRGRFTILGDLSIYLEDLVVQIYLRIM